MICRFRLAVSTFYSLPSQLIMASPPGRSLHLLLRNYLPSRTICFAQNSHRSPLASNSHCPAFLVQKLAPSLNQFVTLCKGSGCSRSTFGRGETLVMRKEFRKTRRRALPKNNETDLELNVSICIEEGLPDDPEILSIAELLRLNVPMAMKSAFDGLNGSTYKTRDVAISNISGFESVELSVLLCNDEFMRKLNKEWRNEDHATDVLSMSHHIPSINLPILILGDIVISAETALRQAEERGHTLLDEIRILLVHGLLHLLGFDHEISQEAEAEMEKEEDFLLKNLGWKGNGLIQCSCSTNANASFDEENSNGRKKEGSLRFYRPKFSYIFCDLDGVVLNSKNQVSLANAMALKEALARGVKVVIATGKARPTVINILNVADLAGRNGLVSHSSPGVFLQACLYSLEHEIPLVAYSSDRCFTLFDHHLVSSLRSTRHEPKAEVVPSVEHLLAPAGVQKLVFLDATERLTTMVQPYWSGATKRHAHVVRAIPSMLEIVPCGTSKGASVRMLLDHLCVSTKQVMAIGGGETDAEILELASLGVTASNDENGIADAIYRHAF